MARYRKMAQPLKLGKSKIPAVICLAAIILICLYSGYIINGVLSSKQPNIPFTLGKVDRDIVYYNSQTLDLYIPNATGAQPLPLVVYVHGGGMTSGDKSDLNPIFLNAFSSAGYAVASINYRLAPQYKYPTQIEDVKCAIRFLRSNAQAYGLNGSEVFAFGTSAGGQLVAIDALTGPNSQFDVGPYLNESSGLTAAVDMFGPANLTDSSSGYSATGIQQVFGAGTNDLQLASPVYFVKANAPPILIVQGVNDSKVFPSQSTEFYNDLMAAADQTQIVYVQNMGHMFVQVGADPINPSLEQIAQDMVTFFDQYK
jgi:acetyl esterase/lipase